MGVEIKPSDLYYRYRRLKETRGLPKFTGKPDRRDFDRNDLYEVIPMLESVMDALQTTDGAVLRRLEEIMIREVPTFITSREEMFDCLVGALREEIGL